MSLFISKQIEKKKKEYLDDWDYCSKCYERGNETALGISENGDLCSCQIEKRKDIKRLSCGMPLDLLSIPDNEITSIPFYSKIESLIKRPEAFLNMGLGLFLYGEMNIGKTKSLARFFSDCILSSHKVKGMFLNFTELIELLRRRRMSNDIANEVDSFLDKQIIFIDGLHDGIDERMYPDLMQILDQIFLRQGSAILLTADNLDDRDSVHFPDSLKEFLFHTKKIKPLKIQTVKKTNHWSGRTFNKRGEGSNV